MNTIITNYTFNATAKTITLSDFTSVDAKRVRFIKNLTTNSFIYKFTDALTITSATNVITFTGLNTGMANTDQLSIQYDNDNGSLRASQSLGVALPIEQVQDLIVTGQASQSAVGQNIILATAGTGAFDTLNPSTGVSYRSWYLQIIPSASLTGQVNFEGSNDNTNFVQIAGLDESNNTGFVNGLTTFGAITNRFYSGKCTYRYIRFRISSAIIGGTIQAITKFSQETYVPRVTNVGTSTTLTITNTNPTLITDQNSAAIIITTTSATINANSISYTIIIPVTIVTGTNPTMDVDIQESDDTGINWFTVYSFPRVTTATTLRTPKLQNSGNKLRYVQTIGGTTPSFTRSISRVYYQDAAPVFRQLIDRTVVLTTLNSVTPSLITSATKNVQLVANIGATTIAPILQLEGSDDNGVSWYSIGTTLTTVASSTVQITVNNTSSQLLRARVSTAGTSTVMGSITLKGF
jgi:hypothetical protein